MVEGAFRLTKEGRLLWLGPALALVGVIVAAWLGRPRPLAEGLAAGLYCSWFLFVIGRWPKSPTRPGTADLLSGLGSATAIGVLAWTAARDTGASAPAAWGLGTAGLLVMTVTLSIQGICEHIEQSQLEVRTSPRAPRWADRITRTCHWMAYPSILSAVANFVLALILVLGQLVDPIPGYAIPLVLAATIGTVCWLERNDDHLTARLEQRARGLAHH